MLFTPVLIVLNNKSLLTSKQAHPQSCCFPQPGLAADMASKGGLVPLGDELQQWVLDNYAAGQSWVDLGTYADENGDDQFYGFFYKVDLKSLVWYSPITLLMLVMKFPPLWKNLLPSLTKLLLMVAHHGVSV
jgi:hypothetical protein